MSSAVRILIGLGLGLLAGTLIAPIEAGPDQSIVFVAEVTGGLWLDALRMTIVPLVFALLVTGVASTAHAAAAGGVTKLSIFVFVLLLSIAGALTAVVAPLVLSMWPAPAEAARALRDSLGGVGAIPAVPPLSEMLRGIIPANPVAAAASGAMLPLVVFALAFGFAASCCSATVREPLVAFFQGVAEIMLVIVRWVLTVAPLGVFALALVVGARTGLSAIGAFAHYIIFISTMCVLAAAAAYTLARFVGRTPLKRFARATAPAQAVAISTQSSLASLPAMLEGTRTHLRIPQSVAGVTLPLAVSIFRITGPVANLSVAIYIAGVLGIQLGPVQLAAGAATAVVMVFVGVGVPSQVSFFAVLTPICMVMGIPIEMLALLIAVETVPDIFRTTANVTMDMSVTTVVARAAGETELPVVAPPVTAALE